MYQTFINLLIVYGFISLISDLFNFISYFYKKVKKWNN